MKVVVEAQHVCVRTLSGIHYYSIELVRRLLARKQFDYELTFFDCGGERGNRALMEKYFGEFRVPMHECTTLDYRQLNRAEPVYETKSYNDYTGSHGDLFHFTSLVAIPERLVGKMVVTVHDMIPVLYPQMTSENFRYNFNANFEVLKKLERSPYIIADSDDTREIIAGLLPALSENIFTVYCGYDPETCFYDPDEQALREMGVDGPFLLFLGMGMRKNCERVIRAFEAVAPRHPSLKLVLAGKLSEEPQALLRQAAASAQASRIILTGHVSEKQKRALFSGARLFMFPSLYEGFGLPVLEAMACGCPVLTSNTSSLPEVAGNAGLLVDPLDVEQMACEVERVLHSDTLCAEMRAKGLARAKQFTWEHTTAATEQVYLRAMSQS